MTALLSGLPEVLIVRHPRLSNPYAETLAAWAELMQKDKKQMVVTTYSETERNMLSATLINKGVEHTVTENFFCPYEVVASGIVGRPDGYVIKI